jgi:hypothetical protein
MQKEQFTPGPWTATAPIKANKNSLSKQIIRANTDWIAEVTESPANANLIAAAPDMYEALERALENAGYWYGKLKGAHVPFEDVPWIKEIKASLKKANPQL